MKKVLLIAAVAGLAMASCKKDYTCQCSGTGLPPQYGTYEYKKVKKKDAQSSCDAFNTSYKMYATDVSCSLK